MTKATMRRYEKCPDCGLEIPFDAEVCPYCGRGFKREKRSYISKGEKNRALKTDENSRLTLKPCYS